MYLFISFKFNVKKEESKRKKLTKRKRKSKMKINKRKRKIKKRILKYKKDKKQLNHQKVNLKMKSYDYEISLI